VKSLVKNRADLGYRGINEFVAEAVKKRTEEIKKTKRIVSLSEEKSPP
jgi:uncharacterized protein (DUF1778 family)